MKNIKRTSLGDKVGRIHMKPQHLDKMGGRRVNALRGGRRKDSVDESNGDSSKKEGGRSGRQSPLKRKAEDGSTTRKEKKRKTRVSFSD